MQLQNVVLRDTNVTVWIAGDSSAESSRVILHYGLLEQIQKCQEILAPNIIGNINMRAEVLVWITIMFTHP